MDRTKGMNRRRFLRAAASAAGLAAASCGSRPRGPSLRASEMATLEAICEQIVPADQDPGAAWAGVAKYIDRQLAGFYRQYRQVYLAGLAEADRRAGGSFVRVPAERQREILREMEKDETTKAFFALVVSHTMQGFYGDPRHGGNRNYCSWRMLGVPPTPVRGRDQYDLAKGSPQ